MDANIFETHYEDYCRQIADLDLSSIQDTLDIKIQGKETIIPFLGEYYMVSGNGVTDASGNLPNYMVCVILSKYLLLCPEAPVVSKEWAALKDFHKMSQFTNLNVFTSDAEKPIVKRFSGQLNALLDASQKLGGKPCNMDLSYDFAMEFKVLPKIDILLLFNDLDDEFPATCSMLFQRHAEHYLDPESLIMTGIVLTKRLKMMAS
ncbi:MAG: DUF3786 domain-containing protein [Desulfobulbaceae bacterium]|nr:DUF3786 domain-containing protein [Desulfobulbaceae bacterium]